MIFNQSNWYFHKKDNPKAFSLILTAVLESPSNLSKENKDSRFENKYFGDDYQHHLTPWNLRIPGKNFFWTVRFNLWSNMGSHKLNRKYKTPTVSLLLQWEGLVTTTNNIQKGGKRYLDVQWCHSQDSMQWCGNRDMNWGICSLS